MKMKVPVSAFACSTRESESCQHFKDAVIP